jgi:hypothetical protein
MPRDEFGDEDDERRSSGAGKGSKRRFDEFECPTCSAYNPVGDGFANNDEVLCNYCGVEFKATVDEDGTLRLKET